MQDKVSMIHGSGGSATSALIREVFAEEFKSPLVNAMEDAAVVPSAERIAITTDSFVVKPMFYPGGDIGRLSVCGTVNDLLARGALPKYITAAFILEEGASISETRRIAKSMADTAAEAGISIVCGDTKVVEGNGGIMINTAGIGFVEDGINISAKNVKTGDVLIVSGTMGEHHAAILSSRLSVKNNIESDNAPLVEMVRKLVGFKVHTIRDITRGGLATVLCELAEGSGKEFHIWEEKIPVLPEVRDFCGIMGLDPLYMGNEGKLVAIVDPADAEEALSVIKKSRHGSDAAVIGEVQEGKGGSLLCETSIGGQRRLGPLQDEGLPRIC